MKNNRRNHNNDDWHNKVGLKVIVQHNDVAKALRKLKKKIAEDGLLQELRKREYYEKPTAKRKRKKAEEIARWRKKERSMQLGPERRY